MSSTPTQYVINRAPETPTVVKAVLEAAAMANVNNVFIENKTRISRKATRKLIRNSISVRAASVRASLRPN
ncbi:Uncharacterised protein [Mycobacterium tuberculosis]|nr:Uncharacterised protein [Mycobacterium tuberculosis]